MSVSALFAVKRAHYRVDCSDPRGWFDAYSVCFDLRISAALYAWEMRGKGWDVCVSLEQRA